MKRKNKVRYQVLLYVKQECEKSYINKQKVIGKELLSTACKKYSHDPDRLYFLIIQDLSQPYQHYINIENLFNNSMYASTISSLITKALDYYKYGSFPKFHDDVLFPTKWSKAIWSLLTDLEKNTVFETYNTCFRYRMWKIFRIFKTGTYE